MARSRLASLIVAVLLLMKCGGNPAGPSDGITSLDTLVSSLQQQSATIVRGELMPATSYPFFSVRARQLAVNGGNTQVFEYASTDDASREAALVSTDGSAVGSVQASWIDLPHFYRSGRIIVLYVGRELAVLQPLQAVLGPPFAQR
jgi:hypothetical protein